MTDGKGAGEGIAFEKSPWDCAVYGADDIKKAYDKGVKAERDRCAKIAESHVTKLNGFQIADAIRGGQDAK